MGKINLFRLSRKRVVLQKKLPTYQKILNFVEKTLIFPVEKKRVNEYLKRRKEKLSTTGFEPASCGFGTTVTPDTCIVQDTNDPADLNSVRHGQFQEK